jgi:hypothetical protein
MEFIADFLLVEMAFDKKTMENKIRGLENQINLHLIKIIRYKDDVNFQKHINDIMNWLFQIQKLDFNKNNRKFSKELYFKLLFEESITNFENTNYIKNLEKGELRRYTNQPIIRNEVESMITLENIQKEMAKLLSQNSIYDIEFDLLKLQK